MHVWGRGKGGGHGREKGAPWESRRWRRERDAGERGERIYPRVASVRIFLPSPSLYPSPRARERDAAVPVPAVIRRSGRGGGALALLARCRRGARHHGRGGYGTMKKWGRIRPAHRQNSVVTTPGGRHPTRCAIARADASRARRERARGRPVASAPRESALSQRRRARGRPVARAPRELREKGSRATFFVFSSRAIAIATPASDVRPPRDVPPPPPLQLSSSHTPLSNHA